MDRRTRLFYRLSDPRPAAGDARVQCCRDRSADPAPAPFCPRAQRLTLLVRRESSGRATAFCFARQGATNVFYWIDGPLGYALAGAIGRDELSAVAQGVHRQLNP